MKTLGPILFCIFFCVSCDSTDKAQIDLEKNVRSGNHELKDAPGIVPADAGLLDIAEKENSVWQQYDAYYRTLDKRFSGESFLDNLKWLTIEHMVRFSNFADAGPDIHRFYLNEIMRRSFVNNPAVALTILDQMTDLTEQEMAKYCYDVLMINGARLNRDTSYKSRHQANYADVYSLLNDRAYNDEGQPRYLETQ